MALTTLPYPNMDFVPLDILTANELDMLVANIDAINNATVPSASIANNAITTAKIADGNVTSAKLADNAVATAKIANSAVTASKIGSDISTAKRTELFSGDSASNITLSQAVTNFDVLEITYRDIYETPNRAIKLTPSNAESVALDIAHAGSSGNIYWDVSRWEISGTTLTKSPNSYQKVFESNSVRTTTTTNGIYITKIVGIKYN